MYFIVYKIKGKINLKISEFVSHPQIKIKNKNNILSRVDSLPDNDLYEMLEILIKSTELKRKLLSNIDSVSGDVHIEKITKNKGIETEEKIYKRIRTIKD